MKPRTLVFSTLLSVAVGALTLFVSGPRGLGEAAPTQVIVELRDGSRLVGRLASADFEFESESLGRVRLPWARVDELRRENNPPRLLLLTRSGDRSSGELAAKEMRLTTSFGEVVLPCTELVRLRPSRVTASTGLRHHWPGEQDARDAVGEAHGETLAAVRFTPGRKGRAFTFTGQGEGVRLGEDVANLGAEDFALAFWFRAAKPLNYQYVMSKRAACSPVSAWEVRVEPDGRIAFVLGTTRPEYKAQHIESRSVVADDAWHHVAVTRNGRKMACYVDGKLDTEEETEQVFDLGNSAPLRLGTGVCAGQEALTHFRGQLDEIRLYNRALKAEEVEALARAD